MHYTRFHNIILTIQASFSGLKRKKNTFLIPKKVLIVQMAKMGDMVCTTPMFRAIKKHYPSCEIWVMGNSSNKGLLACNTDIDGYIEYSSAHKSILHIVRNHHFSAACITTPVFEVLALLLKANIPLIVVPRIKNGWSPYETFLYKLLTFFVITRPHRMRHYAPREYLRLLEPLGIYTEDTSKHLAYSLEGNKKILFFLKEHKISEKRFAIISPSSGNKIKNWAPDRFARIAEYLVAKGLPVVVIGGKNDRREVSEMMHSLQNKNNIIDTLGIFSLDELKALIAQSALFVSVDTGPIYIAEAFDIPTVDIVGPVDENEQPPIGQKHKVVIAPRRKPELYVMNARMYDEREAQRQTELITPEAVIKVVDCLI